MNSDEKWFQFGTISPRGGGLNIPSPCNNGKTKENSIMELNGKRPVSSTQLQIQQLTVEIKAIKVSPFNMFISVPGA